MIRRIIEIDEERCTGCGLCAKACHEGAIAMVDGKARLMRDDYCGGLELAAKKALQQSGKFIPWQVVTVTVDGRLVEE